MIEINIRGGLGNQMFEYAAARNYQLMYGDELILNKVSYQNDKFGRCYSLHYLNIDSAVKVYEKKNIILTLFAAMSKFFPDIALHLGMKIGYFAWNGKKYYKLPFMKNRKKYLYSYFQSERYFIENRDLIREELKVSDEYCNKNKELLEKIQTKNSVCVHIRRGDYVTGKLLMCSLEYYEKGIKYMNENIKDPQFFVFSDDIQWVKDHLIKSDVIHYVDDVEHDYEELQLMYSCKHFIISNSSFSWWAQYLSDYTEKVVIAPEKWMPNDKEKRALYMDNWIILN